MLFGRRKPGYTTTVDGSVDPEQAVLELQKAELAAKKKPKAEVFDINAASETARRLKETGSMFDGSAAKTGEDVIAAVERETDALAAKPEDVRIIHSPVGMPGRALATPLVQKLEQGLRFPPKHCARCLKACEPAKVPYCITHALIEAVKGNVEEGLFFCGANVSRLDRMRSVRELMEELMDDWRKHQ